MANVSSIYEECSKNVFLLVFFKRVDDTLVGDNGNDGDVTSVFKTDSFNRFNLDLLLLLFISPPTMDGLMRATTIAFQHMRLFIKL